MAQSPAFSKSADRNKKVILEQLRLVLTGGQRVLEIASGTGLHSEYFTNRWPEIVWQPTDQDLETYRLKEHLDGIERDNLCKPFVLDIHHWPNLRPKYDAVFSANCIHIAGLDLLKPYVEGAASSLKPGGLMILYGPFRYSGQFTTESNAQFDEYLKAQNPVSGIRDFEAVDDFARECGMTLQQDVPMPANNQFIVWKKVNSSQ